MLQLVYVSTARDGWDRRFDALCAQAGANNLRDEVTGVLLQHEDRFLQVLEGPQATVENTFIRIITDPRHHALALLSRRLLVQRQFGDWPMAALSGPERAAAIARVGAIVAAGPNAAATLARHFGA